MKMIFEKISVSYEWRFTQCWQRGRFAKSLDVERREWGRHPQSPHSIFKFLKILCRDFTRIYYKESCPSLDYGTCLENKQALVASQGFKFSGF